MKTKSILFCLLFALCANSFTAAKAQVNTTDSLALVDLYDSTNGPHWYNHTNWLTAKPVSTWYGVFTNGTTRVQTLYMNNNHLHGTIPASFGNLTGLTTILLYQNQLTGALPSSIGNLVNLTEMRFDDNKLSGAIPAEIGNLTKLYELNLNNNNLKGTIPASMGNLILMKELHLEFNQIHGVIPSSLGNLKKVQYIYLNNNLLSGVIPASLGNLTKVEYIYLNNNKLQGAIPNSFHKFSNLYWIDLSYNRLSQYGDSAFSVSRQGAQFYINNNLFTFDGIEPSAQKFVNLKYAPQATLLSIHQYNNTLSVYAGGTLSNNTYKWFKVGATDSTTIKGDSTFTPTASGKYYAKVANAIATQLTLYTDTISYTMSLTQTQNSIANVAAVKTLNNHFSIYPNPAKDIIHVQVNGNAIVTLTNSAGKILFSKSINTDSEINVSSYANGVYYIQNKTTGEVQKIIVAH